MNSGWLDRIPVQVREYLYVAAGIVATGLLAWVQDNYTTWSLPVWAVGLIASFLPIIIGYVTTWTRQYGRGKIEADTGEDIFVGEVTESAEPDVPTDG